MTGKEAWSIIAPLLASHSTGEFNVLDEALFLYMAHYSIGMNTRGIAMTLYDACKEIKDVSFIDGAASEDFGRQTFKDRKQ